MAKCRILLVDDDIEDYLIMTQAFEDLGVHNIIHYVNAGQKALDYLEELHSQGESLPHIIVLDINMPVMNGITVMHSLKDNPRFKHIPVVIYSTSINPSDETKCMELGAQYCIAKPGNIDEIANVGKTLLQLCDDMTRVPE